MNIFFLWKTKEGKTELITAPLDGLLSAVCCLLSTACCMLSAVCCLPSAVCRPLPAARLH
jgi:hypothetical protein